MCSLCRLPVAKKHNFGQFLIFWGLLYRPIFTDEGQIWCARADQGLDLRAKFYRNVFIVSASGGQNHNFGQILTFGWGSCTNRLLPMRVKFGVLEQTLGLHWHAKFHLNVFIVSASGAQKPQFWANFDFCGAPVRIRFYWWWPNLVCYSGPTVHTNVPKLV